MATAFLTITVQSTYIEGGSPCLVSLAKPGTCNSASQSGLPLLVSASLVLGLQVGHKAHLAFKWGLKG